MPTAPFILLLGRDPILVDTRAQVLARHGYRVQTAMAFDDFPAKIAPGKPDLIILCHTLEPEDCRRVTAVTQAEWPSALRLFLTAGPSGCQQGTLQETLEANEGPEKLVRKVDHIFADGTYQ